MIMMLVLYLCKAATRAASRIKGENVTIFARRLAAESELKYYRYTPDGSENKLGLSDEAEQYRFDRVAKSSKVYIKDFNQNVLLAHYENATDDTTISAMAMKGKIYEEDRMVAISKYIEMILGEFNVSIGRDEWGGRAWAKAGGGEGMLSFIDIGANIGVYTVSLGAHFLNRVPINIFAFEPTNTTGAMLSSALFQNKLSNVYMLPYGVTDSGNLGDSASFVIFSGNRGHNHLQSNQTWDHHGQIVEIETVPIDRLTEILRDRHPLMYSSWTNALWLKMDTEGLEPTVIAGGQESLFSHSDIGPCFISMDNLECAYNTPEINELLSNGGYNLVDFDWKSIEQSKYVSEEAINAQIEQSKLNNKRRSMLPPVCVFVKKDVTECVRRKVDKLKRQWVQREFDSDEPRNYTKTAIIVIFVVVMVFGWSYRALLRNYCRHCCPFLRVHQD